MSGILDWQRKMRENGSPISYGLVRAAPQPRSMRRSVSPEYLEDSSPNGLVLLFPVREFRSRCAQLERELVYISRDPRISCDGCSREFGKRHSFYTEDGSILCPTCQRRYRRASEASSVGEMDQGEADAWTDVAYKEVNERIRGALDVLKRI